MGIVSFCARGTNLTDEDVMKIEKEDGSCKETPLSICPDCFTEQMRKQARKYRILNPDYADNTSYD